MAPTAPPSGSPRAPSAASNSRPTRTEISRSRGSRTAVSATTASTSRSARTASRSRRRSCRRPTGSARLDRRLPARRPAARVRRARRGQERYSAAAPLFGRVQALASGPTLGARLRTAVAGNGRAYVAWAAQGGLYQAAVRTVGSGRFRDAQLLEQRPASEPVGGLDLVVDDSYRATVAWGAIAVRAATTDASATFGAAQEIAPGTEATLASAPDGAAWSRGRTATRSWRRSRPPPDPSARPRGSAQPMMPSRPRSTRREPVVARVADRLGVPASSRTA